MPLHFVLLRPAWATAGWRCHIYFCPPAAEALLAPALGSRGARADRAGVVICPLAPLHPPKTPYLLGAEQNATLRTLSGQVKHWTLATTDMRNAQNLSMMPLENDFCHHSRCNLAPLSRDLCTCFRTTSEICNVWQNKHIVCIPQCCMSNISLLGLLHPNTRSSSISK